MSDPIRSLLSEIPELHNWSELPGIVRAALSLLSTGWFTAQLLQEPTMTKWCAEDLLYLRLGTETPGWCLAADSDMLFLAAAHNEQRVAIRLSARQLSQIHRAKEGSVKLSARVVILGAHLKLYLVGRKVNDYMWKGEASVDAGFLHAAPGSVAQARPSIVIDLTRGMGTDDRCRLS